MPFDPNKIVDKDKHWVDVNQYLSLNVQDRQTFKEWAKQNHSYLLMQVTKIEREEKHKASDEKRMRENPALIPLIQQRRAISAIRRAQARTEDGPRSKHKHKK